MLKRINGVLTPQNLKDAFGSWIVYSACVTCGLCKRTGKTDTMRFIELDVAYPMWGVDNQKAQRQRFRYYKRHIKEVHGGSWDLKQSIRKTK